MGTNVAVAIVIFLQTASLGVASYGLMQRVDMSD